MVNGRGSSALQPVLRALEDRLEAAERRRGAEHASQLEDVLELSAVHAQVGMGLSTVPVLALVLRCSETRATSLLEQATGLAELPEGLAALRSGVLTVEQSAVVVGQLSVLSPPERLRVWQRLLARLRQDVEDAVVCPPARLSELLRRWVVQADPEGAVARRREAHARRAVTYRRNDDGLADLFLLGMSGPVAQACLARIREHSAPVGSSDERTADQRRLDAAADLLLGRRRAPTPMPAAGVGCAPAGCAPGGSACAGCAPAGAAPAGCGCRIGAPVPCGAQVVVHVPLGAVLGTTDGVAEVVGHGPIEPDLLAQLLRAGPVLRAVHVDEDGVPIAVGDRTRSARRDDPVALRAALAAVIAAPTEPLHPRHPRDHRSGQPLAHAGPLEHRPHGSGSPPQGPPGGPAETSPPPHTDPSPTHPRVPQASLGAAGTTAGPGAGDLAPAPGAHPPGTPGPYRVRPRLRRLVFTRAPRCEWPACGVRASRCDVEHDWAHPDGPTCACNLGPMCRRHHQVKQQGWTKTRQAGSAVSFTGPCGRTWRSPSQHEAPPGAASAATVGPATRTTTDTTTVTSAAAAAVPPRPDRHPGNALADLSPTQLEYELWLLDPGNRVWDDPDGLELGDRDVDPGIGEPLDSVAERLERGATIWSLDLDDPYAWLPGLRLDSGADVP